MQFLVPALDNGDNLSIDGKVESSDYSVTEGDIVTLTFTDNSIDGSVSASDYSVTEGDTVTLGFTPVSNSYQWIDQDGNDISGETSNSTDWIASLTEQPPRIKVTNPNTNKSKIFKVFMPITVAEIPEIPIANDSWEPIVGRQWTGVSTGQAATEALFTMPAGTTWSTVGGDHAISVSGSTGQMFLTNITDLRNVEVLIEFINLAPNTGTRYPSPITRRQDASNFRYAENAEDYGETPEGKVSLKYVPGNARYGGVTHYTTWSNVFDTTHRRYMKVRNIEQHMQVKVWFANEAEPDEWGLSWNDASTNQDIPIAGSAGVRFGGIDGFSLLLNVQISELEHIPPADGNKLYDPQFDLITIGPVQTVGPCFWMDAENTDNWTNELITFETIAGPFGSDVRAMKLVNDGSRAWDYTVLSRQQLFRNVAVPGDYVGSNVSPPIPEAVLEPTITVSCWSKAEDIVASGSFKAIINCRYVDIDGNGLFIGTNYTKRLGPTENAGVGTWDWHYTEFEITPEDYAIMKMFPFMAHIHPGDNSGQTKSSGTLWIYGPKIIS